MTHLKDSLKAKADALKVELYALYLAYKDPRVPWYARLFGICVVAYAFSPIDLIPDPIPVLGYLDDLVLVPLGIAIAIKLIPQDVMDECRGKARQEVPVSQTARRIVGLLIVVVWLGLAIAGVAALRAFWWN